MTDSINPPVRRLVVKPRNDEIDVWGTTHQGKVRSNNQDHFLIASLNKHLNVIQTSLPASAHLPAETERLAFLAMVADGVGGSVGGEEASRRTVEAASAYMTHSLHCYYTADANDDAAFARALEEGALRCHAELMRQAQADPKRRGMATTLTLLLGVWPRLYIVQVGDSRYYLCRGTELTQVSRDQTMAQHLIDLGVLRRTDESAVRLSNVLASAIGGPTASPVVTAVENDWGYIHLLCSDGLTKHVPDARIQERLVGMTSAREACESLVQDALDAGGTDNITVIVGRVLRAS